MFSTLFGARRTDPVEAGSPPRPRIAEPLAIEPGSLAHRDLLAATFRETHVPFDAAATAWPHVPVDTVANLRALPVWDEALRTENLTARLVQAYAPLEPDPVLRDTIALQGYEEGRHATLIESLARHYDVAAVPEPLPLPADLETAFLRMGYGECLDSFFAFGLFQLARRSGLFPEALVQVFEPLVQEEARHILFFVNWLAWQRRKRGFFSRLAFNLRCVAAQAKQVWDRVRGVLGMESDHFTKGHSSLNVEVQPGEFLDLCLAEHERRLGAYDSRLLRPWLVPALARKLRWFLK